MVTHVLSPGSPVHLAAVPPVTVELTMMGAGASGRLLVDPAGEVIVRTGVLVLPHVAQRTVVRLLPGPGLSAFPHGSTASLVITTGSPGRGKEVDRVLLERVDVSGLLDKDLVAIEPIGTSLAVSAVGVISDQPVGELAGRARVGARRLLGVDRVPVESALDVVIALDASASMAGPLGDGTVRAAVELLVGLSQVIAPTGTVTLTVLTEPAEDLPPGPLGELAGAAVDALSRCVRSSGSRAEPSPSRPAPEDRAVTWVVTDGLPADADAVAAAAGGSQVRHLVSLVHPSAWDLVRASPDLPQTLLASPWPEPVSAQDVDTALRSLLVGCFPAGSALAARVGR